MPNRPLSRALRRGVLALALAAAVGGVSAQEGRLPEPVQATLERLRATPDVRLRAEAMEALRTFPEHRQVLLDGLARDASAARRAVIDRIRADADAVETEPTQEPGSREVAAPPSRTTAAQRASRFPTGAVVGGGLALLGVAAAAGGGGGGGDGDSGGGDTPPPPPPPPPGGTPESYLTTEFRRHYGLELVRAHYAYSTGATGSGVLVAVVDTGLDIDHPEFAGRIAPGGRVVLDGGDAMSDPDGHGTLVAGIIAANKNDIGMHGVAFGASLLPIKYLEPDLDPDEDPGDNPTITFSQMMMRLDQYRPRIVNNSWGERTVVGDDEERYYATRLEDVQTSTYASAAFAYRQLQQAGMVMVFSGGNNTTGDLSYAQQPGLWAALPAAFPELRGQWLAVVAVDGAGVISASSHRCGDARDWCLAAPGVGIVSTLPGNRYASASGTSMAAPHVSGGLALLAQRFPTLSSAQLVTRLLVTADKSGIYADQAVYGQGLMDLEAATQPVGSLAAQAASGDAVPVAFGGHFEPGPLGDALADSVSGIDLVLKDSLDAPFLYAAKDVLFGQRGDRRPDRALQWGRLQQDGLERQRRLANGFEVSYRPSWDPSGRRDVGQLQAWRDADSGQRLSLGFGDRASWSQGLLRTMPRLRDVGVTRAFDNPFLGLHERAANVAWHGGSPRWGSVGVQAVFGRGAEGPASWEQRLPEGRTASLLAEWRLASRGWSLGLQVGAMQERERVLGTRADLWRGARMDNRFAGIDFGLPLGRHLQLLGRVHAGQADLRGLAWQGGGSFESTGHALGLVATPTAGWRFGALLHAPLAVESGELRFELPTELRPDNSVGWTRVTRELRSERPREYELFLAWERSDGRVSLEGSLLRQYLPEHGLAERDTVLMLNARLR